MTTAAISFFFLFTVMVQTVTAATNLCDRAARQAAMAHAVPVQVMLAIARVETGRQFDGALTPWPWAVQHAGQSYWFDTLPEAEAFVRALRETDQTNIDLGCFQLNLQWHGDAFSDIEAMLDPMRNADYAARFLVEKHAERGNWVDAVAAYHSATPDLARLYLEKVEAVLRQLAETPDVALPETVIASRPNLFPLLQPGASGSLASLVPMGIGLAPLLVAAP